MITTLTIEGMTCNNCVRHVGEAIREVKGVSGVEVDLGGASAMVTHDELTTLPALIAAVESAGYQANAK